MAKPLYASDEYERRMVRMDVAPDVSFLIGNILLNRANLVQPSIAYSVKVE